MASASIERVVFARPAVATWLSANLHYTSRPVVYILDSRHDYNDKRTSNLYIGETSDLATRLRQDLASIEKQSCVNVHVISNNTFSPALCMNLQAYLLRMFAGEGTWQILNRNVQVSEFSYPDLHADRALFRAILDELTSLGLFTRTARHVEISSLYKLSPFKALTEDQADSLVSITRQFLINVRSGHNCTFVLQGGPGTGKTVLGVFLLKLLADVGSFVTLDDFDDDSIFYEFFTPENKALCQNLRLALVIPQQSLRQSIKDVFRTTAGLHKSMVMTAFEVGKSSDFYDLLIVDETHRLCQRASQPSAQLNMDFKSINIALFGDDDLNRTQLDWLLAKSRNQLFLVDSAQGVLPADLPKETLDRLVDRADTAGHHFQLQSQMRVEAGSEFVDYIRHILDPATAGRRQHVRQDFPGYDFRLFENFRDMDREIYLQNIDSGLSRLVAGYAFPWNSKSDPTACDIELDGIQLQWNKTIIDWLSSATSSQEVGSIYTVQGYDLNYVGVIIGPDLRYDLARSRLLFNRGSYHDARGKANNKMLHRTYSDDDLLRLVTQIYAVLLTRGIKGTYVYVCDRALREYLKAYIPVHQSAT